MNTLEKKVTEAVWEQPIIRFFCQLGKVKDDHRSLILVTNGFLELLIESLIKARCKNANRIANDSRSYPYSAKLLLLNEAGVLPDETFKAFDWFRKLRNRAAHDPFFAVLPSDLQRVHDDVLKQPNNLYQLCVHIFGGFWNAHIDVFGPVFAPSILGQTKAAEEVSGATSYPPPS
jgi:hypothetical protein